jgi:hypothetical protein
MGTSVSTEGNLEEYLLTFKGRTMTVTQLTGDVDVQYPTRLMIQVGCCLKVMFSTLFTGVTLDTMSYPKQILINGEAQMIYEIDERGSQ